VTVIATKIQQLQVLTDFAIALWWLIWRQILVTGLVVMN